MNQNQGQGESLSLSLLLLTLLFWICQSLSLYQTEITLMMVSINAVYISVIIIMALNLGALKAVMYGEDMTTWINDEGIELVFFMIVLTILMSLSSYAQIIRNGSFF